MSQFNKGDDAAPEPVDESQKTMSLMGGIVRAESLPEADAAFGNGRSGSRMLGQGTMLILMVAAIAAGSIYLMRLSQGEMASSKDIKDAEARVEQALAKLGNVESMAADDPLRAENLDGLFQDTNSIVTMFTTDMTQRQVPINELQKDPFELMPTDKVVVVVNNSDDKARERQRQQQLQIELSRLKLQTVMQGRIPVAVIHGDFVRVGGTIGSFTVRAIDGVRVELEADGQVFPLTMEDEPKPSRSMFR